jgi:acyl-CoA thioesterase FadM
MTIQIIILAIILVATMVLVISETKWMFTKEDKWKTNPFAKSWRKKLKANKNKPWN